MKIYYNHSEFWIDNYVKISEEQKEQLGNYLKGERLDEVIKWTGRTNTFVLSFSPDRRLFRMSGGIGDDKFPMKSFMVSIPYEENKEEINKFLTFMMG